MGQVGDWRYQAKAELDEEDSASCHLRGDGLCCDLPHWEDYKYEIQKVYEAAGLVGSWWLDRTWPWWQLGNLFGNEL